MFSSASPFSKLRDAVVVWAAGTEAGLEVTTKKL
jgi:hypothetical protein